MKTVPVEDLTPGNVLHYRGVKTTVLRSPEPHEDRFGRPMLRIWASRADSGAEGWLIYGPQTMVQVR